MLLSENRRDFFKALGTGAVALAVPIFAYAQNPLEYPLTSRPDVGTELDEQMAAKVRNVAEYVITRNNQKGLLHFDPNHIIGKSYHDPEHIICIVPN